MRRKTGTFGYALPQRRPLPTPRPSRPLPPAFAKPGSAARTGCRHGKDRGPIRRVVRRLCPQCRSQSARAAGRGARRTRPALRIVRTPLALPAASPHDRAAAPAWQSGASQLFERSALFRQRLLNGGEVKSIIYIEVTFLRNEAIFNVRVHTSAYPRENARRNMDSRIAPVICAATA